VASGWFACAVRIDRRFDGERFVARCWDDWRVLYELARGPDGGRFADWALVLLDQIKLNATIASGATTRRTDNRIMVASR
jgi:hypothetical protein